MEKIASQLNNPTLLIQGDVTNFQDCQKLLDETYTTFGACHLLFNNAGIMAKAGPMDSFDKWQKIIDVNLASIVNLQSLFIPKMLEQTDSSAVVNLGSKEGITTPPGNVAYSVSKAGVKILTEHLQHELRNSSNGKVSAHLLVPGYTWTPMNFPGGDFKEATTKPDAPWSADQVMAYFGKRFEADDFYIICLDNEVTKDMDDHRMRWAMDDIIKNRSALSRWDAHYKNDFDAFMKKPLID